MASVSNGTPFLLVFGHDPNLLQILHAQGQIMLTKRQLVEGDTKKPSQFITRMVWLVLVKLMEVRH